MDWIYIILSMWFSVHRGHVCILAAGIKKQLAKELVRFGRAC